MTDIKCIYEVLPGPFSSGEVIRIVLQVNLMVWG